MKVLKKILTSLIVIGLLFVIIAYFLPRRVHIERSLTMEAPARVIFTQVNDFHCWDKWSVWNQKDPTMQLNYLNSGIGTNAGYSWESNDPQLGSGGIMITSSVPYDSITMSMDFKEKGKATGHFRFKENEGQTKVIWDFDTDLGMGPVNRWIGLMFNGMIGPDFRKGLENLKVVSETIARENQPVVELTTLPDFNYVSIRREVRLENIEDQMGSMYGQLTSFIGSHDLSMTDMPYSIYHRIDNGIVDLEAGIPVNEVAVPDKDVRTGTMKSKRYAHADHIGSFESLEKTHSFIQSWLTKRNFSISDGPMERYFTDPQSEQDTSKWITAIYYPVKM